MGLGLGLAGCGDSSSPAASADTTATSADTTGTAAATTSADATAAVTDAYKALQATSYTSTSTTTQELSAEGVDGALKDQLLAKMKTSVQDSTATSKVESSERTEVVTTTGGKETTVVMYDGSLYVTANGTTWAQVTGDAASAIKSAQSVATANPTLLFTDLVDAGPTTVNGDAGTKYTGGISAAQTESLINTVFGSLGSDMASALGSAMKIQDGNVAVVVSNSGGTVIQQVMNYGIAFDLAALASASGSSDAASSGTIIDTITATEDISNIGDPVTITEPTATTKVSSIIDLGLFLAK